MEKVKMELGKKMDKALHYVAHNLELTGHNSKPVLFHSFKVGYLLFNYGYSENIVVAALLHDLIEDTDITYDDLKNEFSIEVANLVKTVSFNPNISDEYEQAKEMFNNCLEYGFDALIIKCSDLIDNIGFIKFVDEKSERIKLLKKYELFLNMAEKIIGKEEIYEALKRKYNEVKEGR